MRAAVFTGVEEPMSVEDLEAPAPGPRDVVVDVAASGVCHSDLSVLHGYLPLPPPAILGHEGAGTVIEVGVEVTRCKVGDTVVASFVPACGHCWFCLHDQSNLCNGNPAGSFRPRGTRSD